MIRKLSPETIARISAGEVVERPASVVKELVENSVDAGAGRISIAIESGGLALIRITDDGSGIEAGEALTAFDRHATSKLTKVEDLDRIGSYGFRGEALAAVAAAGDIELLTRTRGSTEGMKVTGGGGRPLTAVPSGCETGTTISVRRLFASLPARLKFMKTPQAESLAVARIVEQYALTLPKIRFTLTVDGQDRLVAPPAKDDAERVKAVLGESGNELIAFDRADGPIRVHGHAEPPGKVRKRGKQWFLVNGRPVEDRMLRHAVIAAYAGQLSRDVAPTAVIRVDLPPDRLDVNVHPAKTEVRFADGSQVHQAVYRAIKSGFEAAGVKPAAAGSAPESSSPVAGWSPDQTVTPAPIAAEIDLFNIPQAGEVEILGQMFQTYIAARVPEGLLLVDQHTAHEKIIFERILSRPQGSEVQRLLLPQTLDFSAAEAILVKSNLDALKSLGIELEEFGGKSFAIQGVPPEAADRDVKPMLKWLLEDLEQTGKATPVAELKRKLTATMACHLAVKAGDRLDRSEMTGIVRGLIALKDPTSCPHGRPTFVRYEEGDLAKLFHRTWGLGKRECH